eukprot:TRINITY_DN66964_c4_g2_i1.p1 TRINITY_DN66964_c4_g2~~TRINITY_DN66964_c4_g2_i1.p1  ORF type:complete len:152 (-),score=55.35 TRINITY_DN66964_c4_g2_i1:36-461(-)
MEAGIKMCSMHLLPARVKTADESDDEDEDDNNNNRNRRRRRRNRPKIVRSALFVESIHEARRLGMPSSQRGSVTTPGNFASLERLHNRLASSRDYWSDECPLHELVFECCKQHVFGASVPKPCGRVQVKHITEWPRWPGDN